MDVMINKQEFWHLDKLLEYHHFTVLILQLALHWGLDESNHTKEYYRHHTRTRAKDKRKARGGVQGRQRHRTYYYSPLHPLNSLTKMRFDKETISSITVTCSFPHSFHLIGLVKGKIKNKKERERAKKKQNQVISNTKDDCETIRG